MQAIQILAPGGPDVLTLVERPDPEPAAGEVLIDVAAAGVNRPDLMQREGRYGPPPGVTDIPGLEVAGVIAALGPVAAGGPPTSASGRPWRTGDRVTALLAGGGYATRAVAPGVQCLPLPGALSFVEAAALPEACFTVWANVFESGRLEAGEWFLVHGGASGIGTTAIQLASAFGARVMATAGSDSRARACERLGAMRGVNYRVEDFVGVVRDLTGSRGVDVILDMVGGPYVARNLEALARGGRLVQIAAMGGATAEVPLWPIIAKRLTVTGSTLRPRSAAEKGLIARALEERVWPLIESGRIRPVIEDTMPLSEASRAHARLEQGPVLGKLVLTISSSR